MPIIFCWCFFYQHILFSSLIISYNLPSLGLKCLYSFKCAWKEWSLEMSFQISSFHHCHFNDMPKNLIFKNSVQFRIHKQKNMSFLLASLHGRRCLFDNKVHVGVWREINLFDNERGITANPYFFNFFSFFSNNWKYEKIGTIEILFYYSLISICTVSFNMLTKLTCHVPI